MVADVVSIVQGNGHNDSSCYGRDRVDGVVDGCRVKVSGMISEYVYSNQHSPHCMLGVGSHVGGESCWGGWGHVGGRGVMLGGGESCWRERSHVGGRWVMLEGSCVGGMGSCWGVMLGGEGHVQGGVMWGGKVMLGEGVRRNKITTVTRAIVFSLTCYSFSKEQANTPMTEVVDFSTVR